MGAFTVLIPLISTLLPRLAPLFSTPLAGSVLGKAGDIAQKIFGTTDPVVIQAEMDRDKIKAEQFKEQLEADTESDRLFYADVANARAQTIALAQSGSSLAWGAPLMTVLITVGFIGVLILFIRGTLTLPEFQQSVVYVLVGYLGAAFQQAVNYWLGSSTGSSKKTDVLTQLANSLALNAGERTRK